MLTFLRDTKVECMVSLAPPEEEDGGGENGEEEGPARLKRRRERREGRARPRMNFSSTFLFLFLGASIFFGGTGEEEIREPYYDGNPVWDRKRSFL